MSRYLSWLVNAGLLVLCCFLVAGTVNTVFAAWLTSAPASKGLSVPAPPTVDRSWDVRERILKRNLFNALLAPPPPPAPAPAIIEATKLPLTLIGTVASSNPDLAWAAVNHTQSREHLIVQIGHDIKGKARVERIEARRIVLKENGQLRELVLDDQPSPPPVASKRKSRSWKSRASRRAKARRAKRKAAAKAAPAAPPPVPAAGPGASALTQLLSEVQIVPKYNDGAMVGVQVNEVEPGGVLADLGVQSGDVITEFNGVQLTSPEDSMRMLGEASTAETLNLKVQGEQGEKLLAVPVQQEE